MSIPVSFPDTWGEGGGGGASGGSGMVYAASAWHRG